MGEPEQEEKEVLRVKGGKRGLGRPRVPMTKEALESRRTSLAQLREEIAMETEEAILRTAYLAVATLHKLTKSGRDERAMYSAASKIIDVVLPKATGPLVNLNFGNNFVSHLGLPPPPERPAALPGPIRQGILPEAKLVPRQITPESDHKGQFQREAIDVNARFAPVEVVSTPTSDVAKPPDLAWPSLPERPKELPAVEKYPEES